MEPLLTILVSKHSCSSDADQGWLAFAIDVRVMLCAQQSGLWGGHTLANHLDVTGAELEALLEIGVRHANGQGLQTDEISGIGAHDRRSRLSAPVHRRRRPPWRSVPERALSAPTADAAAYCLPSASGRIVAVRRAASSARPRTQSAAASGSASQANATPSESARPPIQPQPARAVPAAPRWQRRRHSRRSQHRRTPAAAPLAVNANGAGRARGSSIDAWSALPEGRRTVDIDQQITS